ncbi:uncharacterized protein [Venturia canescens]|uniref:uncharacterized protein n=1 Tax=Venturia canescens TaxID=32260 RepID=UPI001C9C4E14|nr:uncharacterized protein LOC122406003 [Venturia canescens]
MSDPEYAYACQRAELLGQPKPSEEEWAASRKSVHVNEDPEEVDNAVAQDLDQSDESMRRVGGGLDELNSILNATQKKINRFKTVCGSLSTLLRVKVGSRNNTPDHKPLTPNADVEKSSNAEFLVPDETLTVEKTLEPSSLVTGDEELVNKPKKIDLNEKMGSHLDKLDSLINKAENAQYSMQHQTKQMKKIINK